MVRTYKQATIFGARALNIKNLWQPSKEYLGKPTEKPNYFLTIIIPKTRAQWHEEQALANFTKSAQSLYDTTLSHIPFPQVVWPLIDGDVPQPGRAQAEWRKGNWILTASSTSPITVTIVQNGAPVPLPVNNGTVKPGDYVAIQVAMAVKLLDPRGVKCYCNNVMFTGPGEEIAIGGSISSIDLMAEAHAAGMNVTGYGAGGPPQTGFGQGFAPVPASPASPAAPAPFGSGSNGSASSPSNGPQIGFAPPPVSPPQQQGFATPGGFNPPQGFPQR